LVDYGLVNEAVLGDWKIEDGCPRTFQGAVPASWADSTGRVRVGKGYFAVSAAAAHWFEYIHVGADFRERTQGAMFAVHSRMDVDWRADLRVGDAIRVNSRLAGCEAKRLIHMQILSRRDDPAPLMVVQILALHFDTAARGTTPFPEDVAERLAEVWAVHRELERPPLAGTEIDPLPMEPLPMEPLPVEAV